MSTPSSGSAWQSTPDLPDDGRRYRLFLRDGAVTIRGSLELARRLEEIRLGGWFGVFVRLDPPDETAVDLPRTAPRHLT